MERFHLANYLHRRTARLCNDLYKHDECELFKGAGVEAMTAPSKADLDSLYSAGVSTWTCLALAVVFDRLEDRKCSANLQYGTFIFSAELRNEFRNLFYRAWLFPHVVDPSLAKDEHDSADDNSPATRLYRWGQAMRRMLLKLRVELDHYVDNDRSRDILNVVIEERRIAFRPTFSLTRDKLIPKWLREVVTPALRCHLHHDVGLARLDTSNSPKTMLAEIVMSVCEGLPDGKRNEAHTRVKESYPNLLTGPIPRSGPDSSVPNVFWMNDFPPELRDGFGLYTEAELDHCRQRATAALRSVTHSPDSALQALTTKSCFPSSVYAANDASNDYFTQLESVFVLFSDP